MKTRSWLVLVLFYFPFLSWAQNYGDSLRSLSQAYFEKVNEADQQLFQNCFSQLDIIGSSIQDTQVLAMNLMLTGSLTNLPAREGINDLSGRICRYYLTKELPKAYEEEILYYLAEFYACKAFNASQQGEGQESNDNAYKALGVFQQIRDTNGIVQWMLNIGTDAYNQNYLQKAEEILWQAHQILEVQSKPKLFNFVKVNGILGQIQGMIGNFEEARPLFDEAEEVARKSGNQAAIAEALRSKGVYFGLSGDMKQAKKYMQESLDLYRELGNQFQILANLQYLSQIELNQNRLSEAATYARNSLELARKLGIPMMEISNTRVLIDITKRQGNYKEAANYYEAYIQLKDTLMGEENKRALFEQEYAFKYQQQAIADSLENASMLAIEREENKRRRAVSWMLGVGLLFMGLLGWLLFSRYRLIRQQKADLDAANTKLKELDDFKSNFFTNISHEFRTPLTVIQGMISQIKDKPEKWLERGTQIIQRNTNSLLNLVNQILDLRKLESGGLSLDLQQGDVIKKLRLGVASFESMAEIKQLALSFESDVETLQMDIDADKLGQIQTNLLSNAIKFTPVGGKVQVEVKQQDNVLEMRVVDSGVGIPAEKLPLIFDRFYQIDSSSTREGEGTGIGLSLTRELVNLMRGTIEVESQVGQGTTFLLRLPITRTAPMGSSENKVAKQTQVDLLLPPAERASKDVVLGKELPSLLIIEDNPDIVEYLYACLDDQYELFSAPDGQAGIEAALEQVPDLIITDVMMPHKNGYEVCENLKQDERTSHIPIVMLTARANQESRLEGYQRGADAYLAKPFEPRELDIRLSQLFKLRQRLQQRYQNGQAPNEPAEDPQVQLEDAFIAQVRAHILTHLDDGSYRGDGLIKDLGMSRSNLHRKLKALTGLSTSHFIRQVRLEEAKKMLRQPDLQAAEIAYATGFNDPNYFNRVFSEVVGMPPNEWRATHISPN